MQNDLDEFFAVADFVNPGLLGSLKTFRSRYSRAACGCEGEGEANVLGFLLPWVVVFFQFCLVGGSTY